MTWDEAMDAFLSQHPLTWVTRYGRIPCLRIWEIGLRMDEHGQLTQIIGAMDYNQNCIYHDTPEHFTQEGGILHGADKRSLPNLAEGYEQPSTQMPTGRR